MCSGDDGGSAGQARIWPHIAAHKVLRSKVNQPYASANQMQATYWYVVKRHSGKVDELMTAVALRDFKAKSISLKYML